ELLCAGSGIATVKNNRSISPLTVQTEIAPGVDLFRVSSLARLRKNGVDLLQGQSFDGVVLVHVDGQHVDARGNGSRRIAVLLLEVVDFSGLHAAAHRSEMCCPRDQSGRSGG